MGLLDDLQDEEKLGGKRPNPCNVCAAIAGIDDEVTREALASAAAGTISLRALERISRKNGLGFGKRTITRHREERHES